MCVCVWFLYNHDLFYDVIPVTEKLVKKTYKQI